MSKFSSLSHVREYRAFFVMLTLSLIVFAASSAFAATTTPDFYELQNSTGTVSVVYSTTSFTGQPMLTYTNGSTVESFTGDEIRVQETEIGKLVSVTVAIHPDVNFVTLSVLIPEINLAGKPLNIATRAILTTHRTPFIVGPLVGQRELYRQVILLKGTASDVAF